MNIFFLIGFIGWLMLIIPQLHFIYKDSMAVIGDAKYGAFFIVGTGMFVVLPCMSVKLALERLGARSLHRFLTGAIMAGACIFSVLLSRVFM